MGSHLRRMLPVLEGVKGMFVLMFVFCSAILVHALLARRLPHHGCVPVGKRLSLHDVLTGDLLLHVVSGAKSSLTVGVTDVNEFAMWDRAMFVR